MGYLYLAPAVALLLFFLAIPLGSTMLAGCGHFSEALTDDVFQLSFVNTLLFTGISVAIEIVLGLLFALLLHQTFRLRGMVRALALIPWALPSAVMAVSWKWIFSPTYGIADDLLRQLGWIEGSVGWLTRPGAAFAALVIADVWKTTPFLMIILLAGLQSISADLYEAMGLDGAGAVRRFLWITLPLLRPALALALLFRVIHAMGIFDLIWVMTKGGPGNATKTVAIHLFELLFSHLEPGNAAACTVLLGVAMFLIAGTSAALVRGRTAA